MLGRGFVSNISTLPIKQIHIKFTQRPVNSFAVEKKFWKGWKKLQEFDSLIQQLVQEESYHLYTHQTSMDFIRLFMSHKQCSGFSLIEEGVVSYLPLDKVNNELFPTGMSTWRYDVLKWINFFGRLSFPIRFFDSSYTRVYGLSDYSFPFFPRKELLSLPFNNTEKCNPYKHILVLDASVESGLLSKEAMRAAMEESLERIVQNNVSELWVKYHPEQLLQPSVYRFYDELFKSFESRINITEIPQDVCLELLAGNVELKELTFYVFVSSVAIYASLCGREVYSFASLISKYDAKYASTLNDLPAAFWRSVSVV